MGDEHAAPSRWPGGWRLAGIAAAVVLLAAVGGLGGWMLAGDRPSERGSGRAATTTAAPTPAASGEPTGSALASPSPSSASPKPEQTSPSPGPGGPFPLPDFSGMDFVDVRRELHRHGLGWRLVFARSGEDRTVERTRPAAGALVRRGLTVAVYVRGAAPPTTVPSVTGLTCKAAAALVVEHGLYPRYLTGQRGRVALQDPPPPGDLHWNDEVRLVCRTDLIDPTQVATPG